MLAPLVTRCRSLRKLMLEHFQLKLLPNLFTFVDETKSESWSGNNLEHEKQKQLFGKLNAIVSKELGRKYCRCDECGQYDCVAKCGQCFL